MKKGISLLLALSMIFGMMPVVAMAESNEDAAVAAVVETEFQQDLEDEYIEPNQVYSSRASASNPIDRFIAAQKELLDDPAMEYRPGTRWWMAEGLHTDETIVKTVKELYDMGIGLIEFVCRDGGARIPDDLDTELWPNVTRPQNIYSWGSEEWRHDSTLAIKEATKYGMGFSITSGTNWGNANVPREYLKPDDDGAGKSLGYRIQVVENGDSFDGVLPRSYIARSTSSLLNEEDHVKRQDLLAVVAMKRDSSSDATLVETGNLASTIAMTNAFPDRVMVYDDSATVVLTDQVLRNGEPVDLNDPETLIDRTGEAEFTLDWTPPDEGTYDIYCFWLQATGQSPTPSSDVNFTINYVDRAGVDVLIDFYENNFFNDEELKESIRANGKGEIYMDSIEISTTNGQTGQFWGLTLMDQFKERHGYDLTPYLPYIIRSGSRAEFTKYHTKMLGSDGVMEEKIRSDVYDVMTNCYIENVLIPLKTWLKDEMNMKLRAEIAYNLPYEVSLSGRGVDYVEAESLDYGEQIETQRTIAGAANVYGKRLSSETGALSGQNYAHGLERYMRTINTQFAGGIQYTVWHGYSSLSGPVPTDTEIGKWVAAANQTWWPGGEVMSTGFSDRIGPRQPAFGHYGDFMTKISRDQAVLQQGKPQIDLAILKTDYYNTHNYEGSAIDVDTMRNRKAMFMKDLSLQDAGYTYNYFAPENLEILEQEGITDYRDGEGLIPDNVGYQAVIVYQENMRVESAQKLLEVAKKGLPIVIVDGLIVRHMTTKGANNYGQAIGASHPLASANPHYVATSKYHENAAVYTVGNDNREDELLEIMDEIKALDNVKSISPDGLPTNPISPDPEAWGYDDEYFYGKTGILEALQELGVRPRAEFTESNKNYLTTTRRTDDTLYVWVYNFMSDDEFKPAPIEFELNNSINISVSEAGKPYTINTWTGDISEMGAYTIQDGRTSFDITLKPGETTIIALDLNNPGNGLHAVSTDADKVLLKDGVISVYATESGTYTTRLSNGTTAVSVIQAPENISLDEWDLTVEDWTRGDLVEITEDRGLGYTTKEAYWTTKKTPIQVGTTSLIPWKDIEAVGPTVSGTGAYTTSFQLPEDWSDTNGAYLDIESLGRNTAYVWVNGERALGLDIVGLTVDVSKLLKSGENTIKVEVSSTLRNRMINLNYPGINPTGRLLSNTDPYVGRPGTKMPPADYGMIGDVSLITYKSVNALAPNKSNLNQLIRSAEQLVQANYTENSWLTFSTALASAKVQAANDEATQVQVDNAANALQAAINSLVRKSTGGGGSSSGGTTPPATTTPQIAVNGSIDTGNIDTTKDKYVVDATPKKDANGTYQPAVVNISASSLTTISSEKESFIIEISTPYAKYQLPTNLSTLIPAFEELLAKNSLKPEDIGLQITLTDKSTDKAIMSAFEKGLPNGEIIGPVVDFSVEIINNKTNKTLAKADNFTEVITRTIPMPKELKSIPASYGAFRFNEMTKGLEFVPHKTITIDGVIHVVIASKTNSVYVVANNPVKFSDVAANHWAAPFIEKAGAKKLVHGVGNNMYDPERSVTRAEFVQMIVNATQLPAAKAGIKAYGDVSSNNGFYSAIMKAKSAGLLNKFIGENFNPNQAITREEMAVILAAVVRREKMPVTANSIDLSTVFNDYTELTQANVTDIELIYKLKIMQGVGGGKFAPKGITTRAQAATVQINLLKALGAID